MLTKTLWALLTAAAAAMAIILAVHSGDHSIALSHHSMVAAAKSLSPNPGPPLLD
jgi:hypothetical protein